VENLQADRFLLLLFPAFGQFPFIIRFYLPHLSLIDLEMKRGFILLELVWCRFYCVECYLFADNLYLHIYLYNGLVS
jgi:hypothetical protein